VDPLSKRELRNGTDGTYKKVPVAIIEDQAGIHTQYNGSDAIISAVSELNGVEVSRRDTDLMSWAGETVAPTFPPNIYSSPGEAWDTTQHLLSYPPYSPAKRAALRALMAPAMFMLGKRISSKRGYSDPRESLYEALGKMLSMCEGRETGGVGEAAVFGMLWSMRDMGALADAKANVKDLQDWYDGWDDRLQIGRQETLEQPQR
jgi:hypothetical protein